MLDDTEEYVDDCKTPGFKNADSVLSTARDKKSEPKRVELYTFAQSGPKEHNIKKIGLKLDSHSSKHKLDFNQFTLSKPRARLSPIFPKENKENVNFARKPPINQVKKKPSLRVLPSLRKGLLA